MEGGLHLVADLLPEVLQGVLGGVIVELKECKELVFGEIVGEGVLDGGTHGLRAVEFVVQLKVFAHCLVWWGCDLACVLFLVEEIIVSPGYLELLLVWVLRGFGFFLVVIFWFFFFDLRNVGEKLDPRIFATESILRVYHNALVIVDDALRQIGLEEVAVILRVAIFIQNNERADWVSASDNRV